jgi:hypothetical protein
MEAKNWFIVNMLIGVSFLIVGLFFCSDCGTTSIGCIGGVSLCWVLRIFGFYIMVSFLICIGIYDDMPEEKKEKKVKG